ncbi:MAG: FHA domain-containing protein, partial [Pseudomonadota bacterium]
NVVDDVETGAAADLEAMMQSLEEEEAQREMSAGDSETQEDEELDTFDATGKADPFDKLNTAPSASKPPVSPLRSLRKTPQERLAASMPDTPPKPEATEDELQLDALTPLADAEPKDATPMPSPAQGRGSGKSGRVKTRLLGFSAGAIERKDPFEKAGSLGDQFPVGWLVVTSDKGRGASFALHDGVSKIGRGTDQTVCLDFGDNSISRDNHLSIAFDAEQNKFFVGHSGKSNLVRLNDKPLLSTEELKSKDAIRLGETTLRFIALCEGDFGWGMEADQVAQNA